MLDTRNVELHIMPKALSPSSKGSRNVRVFIALLFCIFCLETVFMSNAFAAQDSAAPAVVQVEVTHIGDALHLEFTGTKDWKYEFKRPNDASAQVVLSLAGLKPETIGKLKAQTDSLVKSVSVNENGIDGRAEVAFTVPATTDFFDYLTDQPSKLIIDFFPKDLKAAAKSAAAKKPADDDDDEDEDSAVVNVAKVLPAKKSAGKTRKPASGDFILTAKNNLPAVPAALNPEAAAHGVFDGGDPDFSRFAVKDYEIRPEAIAASRLNYYLPFPMLDLGIPQLRSLIMAPPSYEIVPNDTRENQEARIILQLFKDGKTALFLRTSDDFLKAYPESQYTEMMKYMVADTHYNFYRSENSSPDFETAMNSYLQLTEKYQESPITPRTLLLMGYSYLSRGDVFAALKAFKAFEKREPNSKHMDRVKISTAVAYLSLNRFDDAFDLLDGVEKHGKTEKGRQEAAFRKGDVFFRRKDYPRAIEEYRGAMKRLPAATDKFANASYNIAESEFALAKYRDSLDSYTKFVQKFPDHDHGGYAMTRIGELLGILGVDSKRADGAFMESYFRYRATPGAGVARIRMLTSRMPMMKEKELGAALAEVNDITLRYANRPLTAKEKKEADDKAAAMKLADAGKAGGAEKKEGGEGGEKPAPAAKEGGEGGEKTAAKEGGEKGGKTEVAKEKVRPSIILAADPDDDPTHKKPELPGIEEFSQLLITDGYSDRDEFDTAAKSSIMNFQKNPQSLNKNRFLSRIGYNMTEGVHSSVDRGDFIEALRRYSGEQSKWLKNSDRLDLPYYVGKAYEQAGVYKEAAASYGKTLKELNARTPASVLPMREKTPRADQLHLRLASIASKDKNFAGAEAEMKKIKDVSKLSEPEQIERAEVAADVAQARGQTDSAKKFLAELIKTWQGDPRLTAPLHLRIAKIDAKANDFKDADLHLAKIVAFHEAEDYMPSDVHPQALELRGDLFIKRGKREAGIQAYTDLLEEYESKRPLSSVRYHLGQLLYEDGDLKGAEKVWGELQPQRDSLWQRLAAEQMQGAKWQNEYKKYLKRIPAAASLVKDGPSAAQR